MEDLKIKLAFSFFICLVVAFLISLIIYYNYQKDECVSSPLVFAAQEYENLYGYPFIGMGFLKVPEGLKSPTFIFNSTNIKITP